MSYYIYVLVLEHGKYFIGRTNDIMRRFHDHSMGIAGEWTKTHKPQGVERIIENAGRVDLIEIYKEYAEAFGIDNVRRDEY